MFPNLKVVSSPVVVAVGGFDKVLIFGGIVKYVVIGIIILIRIVILVVLFGIRILVGLVFFLGLGIVRQFIIFRGWKTSHCPKIGGQRAPLG